MSIVPAQLVSPSPTLSVERLDLCCGETEPCGRARRAPGRLPPGECGPHAPDLVCSTLGRDEQGRDGRGPISRRPQAIKLLAGPRLALGDHPAQL